MRPAAFVLAVGGAALLVASFLLPAVRPHAGPPRAGTPAAVTAAQTGRALFYAKGCGACHYHAAAPVQAWDMGPGPNLTRYRPAPQFMRRWLRDPDAVRPGTRMPNLGLADDEIEALIAFLTENVQP